MDDEIERLVVSVRADTRGFADDINTMRAQLDGPFADGLERAGAALEKGLLTAIQRGKFGFDDLGKIALSVLNDIAQAAIRTGIDSIFQGGGGGGGQGVVLGSIGGLINGALGLPGRATGGPVSPGRPYIVGERGPEVFVPTSSGSVDAGMGRSGGANVNLTVNISDNGTGSGPDQIRRSSRHLARQLRRALNE